MNNNLILVITHPDGSYVATETDLPKKQKELQQVVRDLAIQSLWAMSIPITQDNLEGCRFEIMSESTRQRIADMEDLLEELESEVDEATAERINKLLRHV
jgi:hypothetical protein